MDLPQHDIPDTPAQRRKDRARLLREHGVPVVLTPDEPVPAERPALVVDALLYPHLNDAAKMLDSGYATVEDIGITQQRNRDWHVAKVIDFMSKFAQGVGQLCVSQGRRPHIHAAPPRTQIHRNTQNREVHE